MHGWGERVASAHGVGAWRNREPTLDYRAGRRTLVVSRNLIARLSFRERRHRIAERTHRAQTICGASTGALVLKSEADCPNPVQTN